MKKKLIGLLIVPVLYSNICFAATAKDNVDYTKIYKNLSDYKLTGDKIIEYTSGSNKSVLEYDKDKGDALLTKGNSKWYFKNWGKSVCKSYKSVNGSIFSYTQENRDSMDTVMNSLAYNIGYYGGDIAKQYIGNKFVKFVKDKTGYVCNIRANSSVVGKQDFVDFNIHVDKQYRVDLVKRIAWYKGKKNISQVTVKYTGVNLKPINIESQGEIEQKSLREMALGGISEDLLENGIRIVFTRKKENSELTDRIIASYEPQNSIIEVIKETVDKYGKFEFVSAENLMQNENPLRYVISDKSGCHVTEEAYGFVDVMNGYLKIFDKDFTLDEVMNDIKSGNALINRTVGGYQIINTKSEHNYLLSLDSGMAIIGAEYYVKEADGTKTKVRAVSYSGNVNIVPIPVPIQMTTNEGL